MSAVVSKKGLKDSDTFRCDDCGENISGTRVIDGEYVYYVKQDRGNPNNNRYRCEECQSDLFANY